MNKELEKEWFTTTEAQNITGFSYKTFSQAIKDNRIVNYKKVSTSSGEKYLLHKDVVYEYLEFNEIKNYVPSYLEIGDIQWVTLKQAGIITGRSFQVFAKKIRNGEITDYKVINGTKVIAADIVKRYVNEKVKILERYICIDDLVNKVDKTRRAIEGLIYTKKIRDSIVFENVLYLNKQETENYFKLIDSQMLVNEVCDFTGLNRYSVLELIDKKYLSAKQINNYKIFVSKKSVDNFLYELDKGITIEELALISGISIERLLEYQKLGIYKSYVTIQYGPKIPKKEKEKVLQFIETYYGLIDIQELFGIAPNVIKSNLIEPNKIEFEFINNNFYVVKKESFNNFLDSLEGIRLKYHGSDDYLSFFIEFMTKLYKMTQYKETIKAFHEWGDYKLANSRRKKKKNIASLYINAIENLDKCLEKELHLYDDEQIKLLFNSEDKPIKTTYLDIISMFMKELLVKKDCSFNNTYSLIQKRDEPTNIEDVIYTKMEWISICGRLSDYELHIKKAINNRRYAETWCYLLLHLSFAWRKEDIKKINNIPIEIVDIYDFEWFSQNTLTFEKAQNLIKEIQRRGIGIKADKNRVNTHLVIGLIVPTAISFIIAEIHCRKSSKNKGTLFSAKDYRPYDFKKILGEELPPFSNRKANVSLLTYGYETAVKKKGRAQIAYSLSTYARSHKEQIGSYNPTTKVYLKLLGNDADASQIAFHLFERGFFGWQINLMIEMIISTELWNLDKQTEIIKNIKNKMMPMSIENVSNYLYTRQEQYEQLLIELMKLPREDIMKKLVEISQNKSPALLEYSQCIKGFNNCSADNKDVCLGCKYHIPTNYILDILNVKLDTIINKLESCDISDSLMRIKLTKMLDRLLFILTDFRIAYKKIDENYFKSFIDIDSLRDRLIRLETEKLLYMEEYEFIKE